MKMEKNGIGIMRLANKYIFLIKIEIEFLPCIMLGSIFI